MTGPRHIIADRRDLFGGRLIPILNGRRMARRLGGKFLMTWHTDSGDFQSLVAGLTEVFTGEIVRNFDPETGDGTVIATDDTLLREAATEVENIPLPESVLTGIPDCLVKPILPDDLATPYCLTRRFSNYRLAEDEAPPQIAAELAAEFGLIEKTPIILDAFEKIDAYLPDGALAALHVRRLHLMPYAGLQVNRFDSFCSTSMCHGLIDSLLESNGDERLLLASDCSALVDELKRNRQGKVMSIDDILDLQSYTGIQQTLIDLYFLSKAGTIFGPKSAYGVAAATIGGGKFRNLLVHIARNNTEGIDETGYVAFTKRQLRGEGSRVLEDFALGNDHSALLMTVAGAQLSEAPDANRSLTTALQATALRFTQYGHACFFSDWQHYFSIARRAAEKAGVAAITDRLTAIERALADRSHFEIAWFPGRQTQSTLPACDERSRLLDLIEAIVVMDYAIQSAGCEEAAGYFLHAAALAAGAGIGIRGLLMRVARAYAHGGRTTEKIRALAAAVDADPFYADAHFALAESLSGEEPKNAVGHYRLAVEIEPEAGLFWHGLGRCLRKLGDETGSIAALRTAVRCEPQNVKFAADLKEFTAQAEVRAAD